MGNMLSSILPKEVARITNPSSQLQELTMLPHLLVKELQELELQHQQVLPSLLHTELVDSLTNSHTLIIF